MLVAWVTSTIFGLLIGRSCDYAVWRIDFFSIDWLSLSVSCAIFGVYIDKNHLFSRILFCLGFCWGFANSAPFSPVVSVSEVIKVNSVDYLSGPVIVRLGDQVFESYGPRVPSVLGRIQDSNQNQMFGSSRTRFKILKNTQFSAIKSYNHSLISAGRNFLEKRFDKFPKEIRAWLFAVIAGDLRFLSHKTKKDFKITGLYHLLSVSGLHVSVIGAGIINLFGALFRFLYGFRLLSSKSFRNLTLFQIAIACALVWYYCALSGSAAAAQRVMLLHIAWQFFRIFIGIPPIKLILLVSAALQTAIFPIGFLSEGCLMSWAAYICLKTGGNSSNWAIYKCNFFMFIMSAAVFSELAPLGLICNLLIIPIFPLVLLSACGLILIDDVSVGFFIVEFQKSFLTLVSIISDFGSFFRHLCLDLRVVDGFFRCSLLVYITIRILNSLRDLSISDYGFGDKELL